MTQWLRANVWRVSQRIMTEALFACATSETYGLPHVPWCCARRAHEDRIFARAQEEYDATGRLAGCVCGCGAEHHSQCRRAS